MVKPRGLIKFLSIILDATPQTPRTNCADLLLLAMFTYNHSYHSSTKMSPFVANFGYNPSVVKTKTPIPHEDATNLLLKLKVT